MFFKALRAVAALGALILTSVGAQAQSRFLVFGDSLSDSGNIYASDKGVYPAAPYYQGRYSNGFNWFDQIAGPSKNFYNFTPGGSGNVDFAFGGALTDASSPFTGAFPDARYATPGLLSQINAYFLRGGTIAPTDTVALWAGGNNLFMALNFLGAPNFPTPTMAGLAAVMTSAAADMKAAVSLLVAGGARKIVIMNLPDLGQVPLYLGKADQAGASYATLTFNQQLAAQMAAIKAANPGVDITQVDIASVFAVVRANPSAFGFANTMLACIDTPSCVTASKDVQDQYLFWDAVHPTESGHKLIAAVVLQYLNWQTTGAGLARLADAALTTRGEASARIFGRLDEWHRGEKLADSPFVELIGSHASGSASGERAGFRQNALGLSVGVVHQFDPSVGMVAEAFFQGGGFRGGAYESDVVSGGADVALGWTEGAYFLRGSTGVSFSYFADLSRTTIFALKNTSNQTGVAGNAAVEGGLAYKFGDVELSPRARFGWLGVNFGESTEAGLIAPLTLSSRNVTTLTGGAEVQATYDIVREAGQRVSLTGVLGYERWFGVSGYQLKATLANNTALTVPLGGSNPTGPGFVMGAGLGGQLAAATMFSVNYRASIGSQSTRQEARASIQLQF